jgi:hypothetical protein
MLVAAGGGGSDGPPDARRGAWFPFSTVPGETTMARYDGGWGGFPSGQRYDVPFRPFGRGGGYGPRYDAGYGRGGGRWEDAAAGGMGMAEHEEFWEPGTVYGPARYGLGPYHERLRRQRRSDDELKEEVEEALFYDTWVDADSITVEVKEGIVTLRGELPDFDEVRYATDDAWDVDGVRGVRSELSIRQGGGGQAGSAGEGGRAGTQSAAS